MGRGAHYGPTPSDVELPRKRRRVEDSYRPIHERGPAVRDHRIGAAQSRRDNMSRGRNERHKNAQSGASRADPKIDSASLQQSPDATFQSADQKQAVPNLPKNKRARKENRSSRIHSLRRQLDRGGLPPTIKRERERELAALVFDQEKKRSNGERKKNLERYHFVRFMERKKATREIRKLNNLKDKLGKNKSSVELDKRLHEAEVDLKYTQYAPLGEKYISLYASHEQNTVKTGVPSENLALLSADQQRALQAANKEHANPAKTIVRASGYKAENGTSMKPPRWYDVEAAIKEEDMSKLQALRDGKAAKSQDLVLGLTPNTAKAGGKRNADWLDDDGVIDPADLDSDSEGDMHDGGVDLVNADNSDDDDDDDDMSDGDGGFFERP